MKKLIIALSLTGILAACEEPLGLASPDQGTTYGDDDASTPSAAAPAPSTPAPDTPDTPPASDDDNQDRDRDQSQGQSHGGTG